MTPAGAVKSAVTGGDVGEGAVTGAVSSGIKQGIDYVGDQFAEPLGTGITPGTWKGPAVVRGVFP